MKKVLVLYPKQFNCFEKFQRKVVRIIENIQDYSVAYTEDSNGFINQLFTDNYPETPLVSCDAIDFSSITHSIIFDDGECFPDEVASLKELKIPFRLIKIKITRVINIKIDTKHSTAKSTDEYEYIGRGSYWGNPYSMYEEGDTREEVIRKYKYDFDYEKFLNKEKSEVYKLIGKRLGCFCKPQSCHGDVLADYLNSWDDGK